VPEVDDGPGGPRGAAGDGEDEEPREEEQQDVGGPDARVHEPLSVLVDVHRRRRLHVVGLPSPPHLPTARRISGLSRRGRVHGRVRGGGLACCAGTGADAGRVRATGGGGRCGGAEAEMVAGCVGYLGLVGCPAARS